MVPKSEIIAMYMVLLQDIEKKLYFNYFDKLEFLKFAFCHILIMEYYFKKTHK